MHIVIAISEDDYKEVKDDTYSGTLFENRVFSAIANGTLLPKGHGRLIDADALIYRQTHHGNYYTPFELIDRNDLDNAPTIIEADRDRLLQAIVDIKAEIDKRYDIIKPYDIQYAYGLDEALAIIDKHTSGDVHALEQEPICPSRGIDCEDCPAYENCKDGETV